MFDDCVGTTFLTPHAQPTESDLGESGSPACAGLPFSFYCVMRIATSYFETDVRCPGVSSLGIALRISSPRA